MTDRELYNEVLNNRLQLTDITLASKQEEYASDESPYHNFDKAAKMGNTTPEKALWGMLMKHLVSVSDMVEGGKTTPYLVNEKIGDVVNYFILLEGILKRKIQNGQT